MAKRLALTVIILFVSVSAGHAQFALDHPFNSPSVLTEITSGVTGNRYRLTTITSWPAANDLANSLGGHLWAIESPAELNDVVDQLLPARQTYLAQYAADYAAINDGDPSTVQSGLVPTGFESSGGDPDGDFYTGLTDHNGFSTEGNFVWTSGDPVTYLNWAGGEPNNVGQGTDPDGEDFMEVWNLLSSRNWNDDNDRGSGLARVNNSTGETMVGLPPSDPPRLPAGGNLAVIELPPLPAPLSLVIDPTNGWGALKWEDPEPFLPPNATEVRSYSITSESAGLDPAAWQASNLDGRDVDAVDASQPGQSWQTVNAAVDQLFEAFLLGESVIPIDGMLPLGQIMQPLPGGFSAPLPDFKIDFTTENPDPTFSGNVQWLDGDVAFGAIEVSPGLAGDFDADGDVDGADFLKWQRDGLSAQDLTDWQNNYGQTSALAATQAVPEPSTALLAMAGLGLVSLLTNRRS